MRPSEGTEEIQSVVLLFSLTCLTEQKERDKEGGGYILWRDSPSACVSVCVFQYRGYIFWGSLIRLTFIIREEWWINIWLTQCHPVDTRRSRSLSEQQRRASYLSVCELSQCLKVTAWWGVQTYTTNASAPTLTSRHSSASRLSLTPF